MLCPTHHQELSINTVDNVQVNECKSCKGIWFGAGELEKVLTAVKNTNKDKYQVLSNKEINNKKNEQFSRGNIYCPSCQIGMIKEPFRKNSHVIVDRCKTCQSCWLDEGELQQLIMEAKGVTILEFKDAKKIIEEELKRYCSKELNHPVNRFANYCETCGSPIIDKKHAKKNSIAGVGFEKEMDVFSIKSETNLTFDLKKLGLYKEHPSFVNISIQENNGIIWVGFGIGIYCVWDILNFDKGPIRQSLLSEIFGEFPIRAKMIGNWIVVWSNKRIVVEDVRAITLTPQTEKVPFAFERIAEGNSQFCPDPLVVEFNRLESKLPCLKVCWLEIDDKGDCFAFFITINSFDENLNIVKSEKLFGCKEFTSSWPYLLPGTSDLSKFAAIYAEGVFLLGFKNEKLEFLKLPNVLDDFENFKSRSYDEDCGGIIPISNINGSQLFFSVEGYNFLTRTGFVKKFSYHLNDNSLKDKINHDEERSFGLHLLNDIKMFLTTDLNNLFLRDPVTGNTLKQNCTNLLSTYTLVKSVYGNLSVFQKLNNRFIRYNLNDTLIKLEKIEHDIFLNLTSRDCLAKIDIYCNNILFLSGLLLPSNFCQSKAKGL